jgi:hypothetical protein
MNNAWTCPSTGAELHFRLARIPSQKAFGMPDVHKSYDIPIKTRKKNADQANSGRLRANHHYRAHFPSGNDQIGLCVNHRVG